MKDPTLVVAGILTLSAGIRNTDVPSSFTLTSWLHFSPQTSCSRVPVFTLKRAIRAK